MKLDLSIIIATLGFDSLDSTLKSVIEYKNGYDIEVLVIGNVKKEIMERYKKIKFIRYIPCSFEYGDLSKKRNIGFENSRGEIVAFIDDDVNITSSWITNGLKHFKDPRVGIVSGPGITPKKTNFFIELFGTSMSSMGAGPVRNRYKIGKELEVDEHGDKIIGCNMFIRKRVYSEMGGFDPNIIPAEEIDFASRAIKKGYKVYMDPQAYVAHFARSNFKKFFRQIFRFGKSKINTIKRRIIPLKLIYLLPIITILLFPAFVIISFFSRILFEILIAGLILYFCFIFIASIASLINTKRAISILLIFTIPLMHLAYGLGEFCEIFGIKTSID